MRRSRLTSITVADLDVDASGGVPNARVEAIQRLAACGGGSSCSYIQLARPAAAIYGRIANPSRAKSSSSARQRSICMRRTRTNDVQSVKL